MSQRRMAFYGKGGVGKTTITANLAAQYGKQGYRVLFVGCDPKADSVRKLTGRRIPTVLNKLHELGDTLERKDIVYSGIFGVSCIEAGGPEAGVGCAGMGLTAMSGELKRLEILQEPWDIILYDVLGDVVCGGFSVPMRNGFADQVFLISSAEYMSLYAANGIMKCAKRYSSMRNPLLGGIILNRCRSEWDFQVIRRFTSLTQTKCLGVIQESAEFRLADIKEETLLAAAPDSTAAEDFCHLANTLLLSEAGSIPKTLDEQGLDDFRMWMLSNEREGE